MDEHRYSKIALGKPNRDHRQMLTNSLLAFRVSGFVAVNLNSTTVSKKMEMMSCFLVTKTHTLIATSVYTLRMFVLSRRRLLSCRAKADLPKYQHEEEVTKFHTLIPSNSLLLVQIGLDRRTVLPGTRSARFFRKGTSLRIGAMT